MTEPSVRIRMYRQGLGDFFLLSFPRLDKPDYRMLVDCGVLQHTDTTKIKAAVSDLKATTGGYLDLVVMTHEHEDHISGFRQASDIFKDITVGQVWLAWTEDPENPVAVQMRKDRAVHMKALQVIMDQMQKLTGAQLTEKDLTRSKDQLESIRQMMRFVSQAASLAGPEEGLAATAGSKAKDTEIAKNPMVEFARAKGVNPTYWYPTRADRPHQQEIIPGVRAYIFGPPEDPSVFQLMDPSKKGKETYSTPAFGVENPFLAAAADEAEAQGQASRQDPFDDFYKVSLEEARKGEASRFFNRNYGFSASDVDKYRRIDADWLNSSSELALKLVDGTNNTSLVLAIELGSPGEGKVLLLAADAQVGNWLSWGPLQWTIQIPGGESRVVKTRQLLGHTVLYKVGHHGSDNATLRSQGLELMPDEGLVAMLPVDEQAASHVKGDNKPGWKMPAPELYARLKEKTMGRVLRADLGLPARTDAAKLTDDEWKLFVESVTETDLYIEYLIG